MKNNLSFYVAGQYVFEPVTLKCIGRVLDSEMREGDGKQEGMRGWYTGVSLNIEFFEEANTKPKPTNFVIENFSNQAPIDLNRSLKV